jgi:DNA-binding IclR family transcriptional regulator
MWMPREEVDMARGRTKSIEQPTPVAETAGPATSQGTLRALDRALDVLEVLERAEGSLRLTQIARQAGLHPATTLRILGVLQRRGFVTAESQAYRLGAATLATAHGFLVADPMVQAAKPILRELSATTKLTASLHQRSGMQRILVARVDGDDPLRYQLPIGQRLPLHLGAGKVIAADLDADELNTLFGAVEELRTASGVVLLEADFRSQLHEIAAQGWHLSLHEREMGAIGLSVPVRRVGGPVVAALSLSGPSEHHSPDELVAWVPEAQRAAVAIGRSHL